MTMSPYENNPIAQRKAAVRKHSKAIQITAGVGGGLMILGALTGAGIGFIMTVLIIALVVGGYNGVKISQIINQKDNW